MLSYFGRIANVLQMYLPQICVGLLTLTPDFVLLSIAQNGDPAPQELPFLPDT